MMIKEEAPTTSVSAGGVKGMGTGDDEPGGNTSNSGTTIKNVFLARREMRKKQK